MHIYLHTHHADKTAADHPWVDDSRPGELWITVEGPGGVQSSGDFDVISTQPSSGRQVVKMHKHGEGTFHAGKFGVIFNVRWIFQEHNIFIVKVTDAQNENAVILHGNLFLKGSKKKEIINATRNDNNSKQRFSSSET